MAEGRIESERHPSALTQDVERIVQVLREAIMVIDDYDPDRNPARCMRQIRRLLDDPALRMALTRVAAAAPLVPDAGENGDAA
ncbi:MAG: hypothetical protein IT536_10400 [Hyphomicrobiales bacterium]|nr:hypothetical protein [Hyphomicrobiales bacterium]